MIINKRNDYIQIIADDGKVLKLPDSAICESCYCPLWINLDDILEIDEMEVANENYNREK